MNGNLTPIDTIVPPNPNPNPQPGDTCFNCGGDGVLGDGTVIKICPDCNGTGKIPQEKPDTPVVIDPVTPPVGPVPDPVDTESKPEAVKPIQKERESEQENEDDAGDLYYPRRRLFRRG